MTNLPLSIGPLEAQGFVIRRSGVHWLRDDGHWCLPDEVIGFCNISVESRAGDKSPLTPFVEERELQVAFAPRYAGRLKRVADASAGGYLDVLGVQQWDSQTVIAFLDEVAAEAHLDTEAGQLRQLIMAGRRTSDLAEAAAGPLSGWHNRTRAWWSDESGEPATLLSLGICDATGVVRGDSAAFFEVFAATPGPAHFVFVPDHPNAPCARILFEQFVRTPAQRRAIEDDLKAALERSPTPEDWMFAGALLASLGRCPMRETYEILTPRALRRTGPADFVLLSLTAEPNAILVHKKLGYAVHILRHHQRAAGPAIRAWLASSFEVVKRSAADIRRDYARLFAVVGAETGAHFLVLNRMSTSGNEEISNYAGFDAPMGDTLANIASKELNLMLHELEDTGRMTVIDVDALAAELGGAEHLPDGIHQSGAMQAALRDQILQALGARAA